jgi:hypothetical protein
MDEDNREFIERRITIGLVVSTDYIIAIRKSWNSRLLESATAKRITGWCIDYFDKYKKAPGQDIQSIYNKEAQKLKKAEADDIVDVLEGLSDEYERAEKFNAKYLHDQTIEYFEERNLKLLAEDILDNVSDGALSAAKDSVSGYIPAFNTSEKDLDLAGPDIAEAVERAFNTSSQSVVSFNHALGELWNDHFVREGFVALMAPEKRGKTFMLLDIAIRAARQRSNVAFFQAGDMSQEQQLRRIGIYLTRRNDKEKYNEEQYEPVKDCIDNQMDVCTKSIRECDFGVFEGEPVDFFREKLTRDLLISEFEANKNYKPCYNCMDYLKHDKGTPWLKKIPRVPDLSHKTALRSIEKFFRDRKLGFRLSTHANSTLSVTDIEHILDGWERDSGFVPDLIVIDYADILAAERSSAGDFRHQENEKWKKMRGLSQKKRALVITVTQTDADSYKEDTIGLGNFSEDKRKFAHVTAMFGLNQDAKGREKELGIMRINEIVIRDGEFSKNRQVKLLQNLRRGQPNLANFW